MCVVLGVSVISVFNAVAFLACAHRASSMAQTGWPSTGVASTIIPIFPLII